MAIKRQVTIQVTSDKSVKNVKALDKAFTSLGKNIEKSAAKVNDLDDNFKSSKIKDFTGNAKKAGDQLKKTNKQAKEFSLTSKDVTKGALNAGTAILALSGAVSAMVLTSASSRRELELLSVQAKTSTEDFQSLAFATAQYGISAEQIGDISKDISDKLGEFATAGTGVFQDYADVMKLSKEQAKAVAIEFQSLSSVEVIGKMVSEMERVGATGSQMTFVLESMGNDLSKLAPLFKNNSKALIEFKKRFDEANRSLKITNAQAEDLKKVSATYELMTTTAGNAATAISATLAPAFDDFFNDVIDLIPQATRHIIDFLNSIKDPKNINSIPVLNQQLSESIDQVREAEERLAEAEENRRPTRPGELINASEVRLLNAKAELATELKLEESRKAQLKILEDREAAAKKSKTTDSGGSGGSFGGPVDNTGKDMSKNLSAETALLEQELQLRKELRLGYITEIQFQDEMELNQIESKYLKEIQSVISNEKIKGDERTNILRKLNEQEEAEVKLHNEKLTAIKAEEKIKQEKLESDKAIQAQAIARDVEIATARIDLKTAFLIKEAELKQAFRDGEGTAEDLAFEVEMERLRAQFEVKRQAILDNEKLTAEQKKEVIASIDEQEKVVIKEKDKSKEDLDKVARRQEIDRAVNGGLELLGALGKNSKKAFKVQKIAAISNATIKGGEAAVDAWTAGMATGGPWAPAVAAAYTGASLLKTGKQISEIKSQKYGGGAPKSGGGGGGLPSAGGSASPDSITSRPDILQRNQSVESTELNLLRQQLSQFDDNDVLPVSFTRRLANSLDETIAAGTVTSETIGNSEGNN